jgi:hypothetical protein
MLFRKFTCTYMAHVLFTLYIEAVVVVGFTTTCAISAYPAHGQVYSINIM